ncbi:MAG: glycoside hydrolase family 97 protein [Anaerolineales bacterium]
MMRVSTISLIVISLFLASGCEPSTGVPPERAKTLTVTPSALVPSVTPTLTRLEMAQATLDAKNTTSDGTSEILEDGLRVESPNKANEVVFGLVDGVPYYRVNHNGKPVILPSKMGFVFLEAAPLTSGLTIADWEESSFDETWTQPWGEVKEIRDHHNELRIRLSEVGEKPRELIIVFRAFDDGIGFRYEFPEQPHLKDFQIMDEQTQFAMAGDYDSWWIPAYQENRYEYLYTTSPLSFISQVVRSGVHTPFTMITDDGLFLSIHEAALVNYSSMTLQADENLVLKADLVPWSDGTKVKGSTPLKTPWRTIQIAENAGDLITSYLILNLNEPNALGDISWVQPGKYIGIWWGMHIGKWTWGSGPNHGATTANARAYLDFAAEYGFDGVLVEGWNRGWDGDWTANGDQFDFIKPYPDFDLESLAAYAQAHGTRLIGHHETGAAVTNYESQMEAAFALYQRLGINTVKTGYVGWGQGIRRYDENGRLVGMEWHHGQYMVEHHQRVIETAAKYGIMINAHEPIKDTGLRRTYPNFMTREGARGQEYNAWDDNPPDHVTILPFTRLLAGPMDYTPGVLALDFPEYRRNRVDHTLAKELALYVVIYSPLQMAADLIENYEDNPAFQFILDVPADWHETRVLHAQIGDFITTVRRERDGDTWFLGSITDENPRLLESPLDFLTPGVTYVAEIYADGDGAHYLNNAYALETSRVLVDSTTLLKLDLAPGGGQAIRFYPASREEIDSFPIYQP